MRLVVDSLTFFYPHSDRPALHGVSLSLGSGEYLAVLGANGSGKSTLVRCIAGLITSGAGTITVGSEDSFGVPSALVFQSPTDQAVAETVELDAAFGPENIGMPYEAMHVTVPALLSRLGLEGKMAASVSALPSGQLQNLALAGVMAIDPALLLLDEPTSMLSASSRQQFLEYMEAQRLKGRAIIHVTHDMEEALRADRIIVLSAGVVVFAGTSGDFSALDHETLLGWGLATSYSLEDALEHSRVAEGQKEKPNEGITGITGKSPVLAECSALTCGPLREITLALRGGTITAVTGESGSGKSLLLALLTGLVKPESGSLTLAEGVRPSLAVQESEASLFAEFVADDVAFGPANGGLSGKTLVDRVRLSMNLAGLPFERFADRKVFTLSGGEKRKAALAGILAMDSPVILLDEPTSALDTKSRSEFLSVLARLKHEGKAVLFTTNRMEELAVADVVVALGEGSRSERQDPVAQTTPLRNIPPLSKYFFCLCGLTLALAMDSVFLLAGVTAVQAVITLKLGYSLRKLARGILTILPWLVLLAIFQYFFIRDLPLAVLFIVRFLALYLPLTLFTHITSPTEIMYGMEDILSPLKWVKVPVRDISLVTGLVFRFLPLLSGESERIMRARTIRGAGTGSKKGIMAKIRLLSSLFVPLVLRTFVRAERMAEAITARYYGKKGHSRYLHWKTDFRHPILLVLVAVTTALMISMSIIIRIP